MVDAVACGAVEVTVATWDVDVGADNGLVVVPVAGGVSAADVAASALEPDLLLLGDVTRTTTAQRPQIMTTAVPAMIATTAAVDSFFLAGICGGIGIVGGYVKTPPESCGMGRQQDTGWLVDVRHRPARQRY